MNYTIEKTDKTLQQFAKLNCPIYDSIYFLPENLETANNLDDFIFVDTLTDIRKVYRKYQIPYDLLGGVNKPKLRTRKNADWFGPTIFIGFSLFSQNSELITVALNVLSNYLSDFFKGMVDQKNVKIEIIIETKKNIETKKITYEGDISGLTKLDSVIDSLRK